MIEIKNEYEEKRIVNKRTGRVKIVPSFFTIQFKQNGVEIAYYNSNYDTLYLSSRFLTRNFKSTYEERIIGSSFENEYKELLKRFKRVSEYMNI